MMSMASRWHLRCGAHPNQPPSRPDSAATAKTPAPSSELCPRPLRSLRSWNDIWDSAQTSAIKPWTRRAPSASQLLNYLGEPVAGGYSGLAKRRLHRCASLDLPVAAFLNAVTKNGQKWPPVASHCRCRQYRLMSKSR